MKRFAQFCTVLVLSVVLAVPVMADIAPMPSPASSGVPVFLVLGIVAIAVAVVVYLIKKHRK
ncbi:MAG: hypothetical protein IJ091_06690 [Oscillospiraceae bacterium]|nr:hypothetical protein [Oscillospiraceae bacterium]